MKTNLTTTILLALTGVGFIATSTLAAITTTTDDFSTGIGDWKSVGEENTLIGYDNLSAGDYDDGDPDNKLAYAEGMSLPGDGVKSDGGLKLDTRNTTVGDEALGLSIAGTMDEGERITFTGSIYNDNGSYSAHNVQLWNLSKGTLLADSGKITMLALRHPAYAPKNFRVTYTASSNDAGDILQIRFLDNSTSPARDVYVDNFSVSSLPPIPPVLYAYEGFNTIVTNGTMAEIAGVTGSGFLQHSNTNYRITIFDGLKYVDANENALHITGKSAGMTNLVGGTQSMQLLLENTITSADADVIYMSYLHQIDSANSWGMEAGLYHAIGSALPTNPVVAIRSTSTNFGLYGDHDLDERSGPDSTPAGNLLMFVVAEINLNTGEATAWINPTNLGNVRLSAKWTLSGATTTGRFLDINSFAFSRKNGSAKVDEIRIGNTLASVVPHSPVLYGFEGWMADFGLRGSLDADPDGDYDGDRISNISEYGLGGDPTNPTHNGHRPTYAIDATGNWMSYVYPKRRDTAKTKVGYTLEQTDDLRYGKWTPVPRRNKNIGSKAGGFGAGFDAVTNRISITTQSKQFIRLRIKKN